MYIFIDESGRFNIANPSKVSCVAAIVVPECFAKTLFWRFKVLTKNWRKGSREIKGSALDESQVADVIQLLRKFDVIMIASCIDMEIHDDKGITSHKNSQADKFLKAADFMIHENPKKYAVDLSDRTRKLANQLFVQATVLNNVVDRTYRLATMYYVQRIPKTLGRFKWIIDAKDKQMTPYEELWQDFVRPSMQSASLCEPMDMIEGADYSSFKVFEKELPCPPKHLQDHVQDKEGPFQYTDIDDILTKNIMFADSKRFVGLQIVDIVASSVARACNGTLQKQGWQDLGRLVVQDKVDKQTLRLLTLQDTPKKIRVRYYDFVKSIDANCKSMLTKATRSEK